MVIKQHESEECLYLINGFKHHYINPFDGSIYNDKTKVYIKTQVQNSGYAIAHINEFGKRSAKTVHRLMAKTFIPNPENKPQVNHKDCNKLNNCIDNLEWSTRSENMIHSFKIGQSENRRQKARERMKSIGSKFSAINTRRLLKSIKERSIPVLQYSLNGEFIREYPSIKAAKREAKAHHISKVINGNYKQSGGYKWKLK